MASYMSLHDHSVHAFNRTAKRWFIVTSKIKDDGSKNRERRAKHAVDIEDLRTARLSKRNEKD